MNEHEFEQITLGDAAELVASYLAKKEHVPGLGNITPFLDFIRIISAEAAKDIRDPKLFACMQIYLNSLAIVGRVDVRQREILLAADALKRKEQERRKEERIKVALMKRKAKTMPAEDGNLN